MNNKKKKEMLTEQQIKDGVTARYAFNNWIKRWLQNKTTKRVLPVAESNNQKVPEIN
jgi:hypothetical protein